MHLANFQRMFIKVNKWKEKSQRFFVKESLIKKFKEN